MAGKQAKVLTEAQARSVVRHLKEESRYADRNVVIFYLSYLAGLRASEISKIPWEMVLGADGRVQKFIELRDSISKKGAGRIIPMHSDLQSALIDWRSNPRMVWRERTETVILSMRNAPMSPHSIVLWFKRLYSTLGIEGASSHSGRRTLATRSARNLSKVGGSLKDLQSILGHKNVSTTQLYVDVSSEAKRKLIDSL